MRRQDVQHSLDERIAAWATGRFGVAARRELVRLGASPDQIRRRVRAGRLILLHPGVYAVGHGALRVEGRWLAATLACGPGAVLSHTAAAALWDVRPTPAGPIHVTTRRVGRMAPKGVVLHTTTRPDATVHRGIPVTTPMRTLCDLAAVVGRPALARAVEAADVRRLLEPVAVRKCAGAPALRALLDAPAAVTRSDFEAIFLDLCARRGLPRPLTNHRIGRHEVDAVWLDRRLVVECDGYAYHGTRRAFERDRRRDAELLALGFRTLRLTYRDVTRREAWVARVLEAARAA